MAEQSKLPTVNHAPRTGFWPAVAIVLICAFASFGLTAFDDLIALTIGAKYGNEYHGHLLSIVSSLMACFPGKVQI